ncbi:MULTISPECIES: hypothetical protein [unclassified Amycolatopsis]|uniref:hypothetical protein n=1 Tax=unclassified Amycolatopsis TaxID=2618356 RepID=UPI001C6A21AB|nr:hypothetical protein [Amycolatopsis sp. DSM 110486]QYN18450.1 hypothetical protein K1T34_37750 [Amycolatopsis sp. DSM 110486]
MSALLCVGDLDTHGEWLGLDVGAELLPAYCAVTGWSGDDPPAGLASVVGRLAYTRGRDMPPGGVLREISQTTQGAVPADGRWQARISSTVLGERSGRRRLAIVTDLRSAIGEPVASVRFVVDWPAGAA